RMVASDGTAGGRPTPGNGKAVAAALAPVAPLRLPAHIIDEGGTVDVDAGRVAVTAATTVNFDLRSVDEQHALVGGMGRWLNALSGPVQIVISTRRVDMHTIAERIEDRVDT